MPKPKEVVLTIDPEKLLVQLNSKEEVSEEDLAEVARLLEISASGETPRELSLDDIYALLLVLGRAKRYEYRYLLEQELERQDPFTVVLVLELLCLEWGNIEAYDARVLHYAFGVSWDEEGDVRTCSLKVLGEHLFNVLPTKPDSKVSSLDKQIIDLLLATLADEDEDPWLRQQAYFSLCRARKKDWEEIPCEQVLMDLGKESKDIDDEVLSYLREVISSKSSSDDESSASEESATSSPRI